MWSALLCAVMTHAGRCCRSRFEGATPLTRSLLRQAVSIDTRKMCHFKQSLITADSW